MRHSCRKRILLLTALVCTISVEAQKGFRDLFNGKDLSGWERRNGRASFEAKNGEIVGTTVLGEPNSFLATTQRYRDFVLELDCMVDSTINSGIQFRSDSRPDYQDGRVHGYQAEIDPSPRAWSGGIYDEARRLWLYTLEYHPAAKKAFRQGAWNHYRIECIGYHVRIWVNGMQTAHLVDTMQTEGFIALQVHSVNNAKQEGKQIRWRNIRIRTEQVTPKPSDPIFVVNLQPNTLSREEQLMGMELLWDGQSTRGWRGAYKPAFPERGWQMGGGIISVLKAQGGESVNGGDIVTERTFGTFELQFDFRYAPGANSGVKYFVTEQEGNTGSAIGLEYQILDDEKHPDALQGASGNRTLASLYDLIASLKISDSRRKPGVWNRGMIRVHPDNRIEHFLNGYKVVEYQRGTQMFAALVARSKYAQWKDFGQAPAGRILLQDHGDAVDFRSIKIRQLVP